jgi:hypothetical protein
LRELDQIHAVVAEQGKISPLDLLKAVSKILSHGGIRFAVAGGFARSIHASPRATGDVDMVLASKDKQNVESILKENGFMFKDLLEYSKPARAIIKFEFKGRELDLVDYSKHPKFVDFLLDTNVHHDLLGVSCPFLGLEGLIVTKLCSFRYKDKADLVDLLREKKPDLDVVKTWCSALGIMDRFSFMTEDHKDQL